MTKPAFFVDGQTEQKALFQLCPGNPIRLIGCNGKSVSMEAIAKRLATQIKLLSNRNYPIIVLIDREQRKESCTELIKSLTKEVKKLNKTDEIIINVCDRMIENWILADTINFRNYIKREKKLTKTNYEGTSGKSVIKKYYPDYHETTDGVNLLVSSNLQTLAENSNSFKNFGKSIKKIGCSWLTKK